MTRIYWRPQSTPLFAFIIVALFSLSGIIAVEHFQTLTKRPYYREKIEASKLALEAMQLIKEERLDRGIAIDPETDPAGSGLIGAFASSVTSDTGILESKQTSANPNFAAVMVHLLKEAHVKDGDDVAVSFSGSFPALNICVYSALTTLHLKPTVISSASASQWGANDPGFLWIDMENFLYAKGLFPSHSVAASMGGKNDRGKEMTESGRRTITQAIERNGLFMIEPSTVKGDIDERMRIYFDRKVPKAYINVGGGRAAVGIRPLKRLLKTGLLTTNLPLDRKTDSLIARFLRQNIPVIQIDNVTELAREYGLPLTPAEMPAMGEGKVYYEKEYNLWLAGGVLLMILFGLFAFIRADWGFRMLEASGKQEAGPPEPMI